MAVFAVTRTVADGTDTTECVSKANALLVMDMDKVFAQKGTITIAVDGDATKYDGKKPADRAAATSKLNKFSALVVP